MGCETCPSACSARQRLRPDETRRRRCRSGPVLNPAFRDRARPYACRLGSFELRSFEKVDNSGQFGARKDELLSLLEMALPELSGLLWLPIFDNVQHHPVGLT